MGAKGTNSIFRQKLELLILCGDSEVIQRAKEAAARYSFSFAQLLDRDFDNYFSDSNVVRPQVTLICQGPEEPIEDLGRRANELLAKFPKSCVVTVLNRESVSGDLSGLQNLHIVPLSEDEFYRTTKFEYACLFRARAQFINIQKNEVFPGTTIPFSVYIKLPLNQKYLAVIFADSVLTDERFQKITEESDHLLIDIGESALYANYISSFFDQAGIGLRKRTRALFLSFCHCAFLFHESLLFDNKRLPQRIAEDLFYKIKELLYELLDLMKREGDLWDVFREACHNEFFVQWRAPWIAVYASLISVRSGQGEAVNVGIAALLTDLGLYDMSREAFHEFLDQGADDLQASVMDELRNHPVQSLSRLSSGGIPLEDRVQRILVTVHEHADGTGFPSGLKAEEIPIEAAIIRLAEQIDFQVRNQFDAPEFSFKKLRENLISSEEGSRGTYPPQFFEKVSKALL